MQTCRPYTEEGPELVHIIHHRFPPPSLNWTHCKQYMKGLSNGLVQVFISFWL
jgi:hypothetical protein